MGGDEFVLILPGLRMDQIQQKIQRLRAITADAGRDVCGGDTLSLSIGHALFPEDGADADQLLSEADRRMYIAKQKEKMNVGTGPRGFEFEPTGTWQASPCLAPHCYGRRAGSLSQLHSAGFCAPHWPPSARVWPLTRAHCIAARTSKA